MNLLLVTGMLFVCPAADSPSKSTARQGLQAAQSLVGSWRGTGAPKTGTREERDRGFWQETVDWQWQFKGQDVWLRADIDKGRYFKHLELRYLPDRSQYQLQVVSPDDKSQTYTGKLDKNRLLLDRVDPDTRQTQRLVISMLHSNRYLITYEIRKEKQTVFAQIYQIGATRQGVPFASLENKNECIVSGGQASIAVNYGGKTYYVCCSGCRSAFFDDPEKFIKEYEAAQKKP